MLIRSQVIHTPKRTQNEMNSTSIYYTDVYSTQNSSNPFESPPDSPSNPLDNNHPTYEELEKMLINSQSQNEWKRFIFKLLLFIIIASCLLYINNYDSSNSVSYNNPINLDYIRPDAVKCNEEGVKNGLYCWGGFKHERDYSLLASCSQHMERMHQEFKYGNAIGNQASKKVATFNGPVIDWNTYERGGLLPLQNQPSACAYILKALEMIDDGKPYMPNGKMIYCGKNGATSRKVSCVREEGCIGNYKMIPVPEWENEKRLCNNPEQGAADGQRYEHHPNRYDDYKR